MILLALCLIQASADDYYFKIKLSNENGEPEGNWSKYIKVEAKLISEVNGVKKYEYTNGLRQLLNGGTVKDEGDGNGIGIKEYTLPKIAENKGNPKRIWGIVFANGKGRRINDQSNILEGDEFKAWTEICEHIKYLELREYELDTYTGDGYFMNMHNVEKLELPKGGMKVGNGDKHCNMYFANADKLKEITGHLQKRVDSIAQ